MTARASVGAWAVTAVLVLPALPMRAQSAMSNSASARSGAMPVLEIARPNDNRRAAGVMRGDTLVVQLDIRMARWYAEADSGAYITAAIVGEVGQAPQVPEPLIHVAKSHRSSPHSPTTSWCWTGMALRIRRICS